MDEAKAETHNYCAFLRISDGLYQMRRPDLQAQFTKGRKEYNIWQA
jgi:hypothetical protein